MESIEAILGNVFNKPIRELTERQRDIVFYYIKDWAKQTSKQRKAKASDADRVRAAVNELRLTKERVKAELRAKHKPLLVEREQAEYTAGWDDFEKVDELKAEHSQVKLWADDSAQHKAEKSIVLKRIEAEIAALTGGKPAPAQTAETTESTPVVTVSDDSAPQTTAPVWSLKRPQRFQGYGKPLYDFLKAAHIAGHRRPNARDLLDSWKSKPPPDVAEVTNNGLKYYDVQGNTKPADLEAIRKAIGRMTQ